MNKLRYLLDKFENRREDKDERFAGKLNEIVDGISDRRTLNRFLVALSVGNLALWASVVLFPSDVRSAYETVTEVNSKIAMAVLGIPFTLGLFLAYTLFRIKFPAIEELRMDSTPMASFDYHSRAHKRWWIWLFSVVAGVLNLLLLIIADIGLSSA